MRYLNILFLAILFTAASATTSFAQSPEGTDQILIVTETMKTKVKGITCSKDLKTISMNVEKLEGVRACKPGRTGATTTFEIAYNPGIVSEQEIYAAIENTGGCKNPDDRPYKVKQ